MCEALSLLNKATGNNSSSLPLMNIVRLSEVIIFSACYCCMPRTEREEAEGLQSELEWLTEMTEDEYNELTPRTRLDVDHIRLQLNKERLKKYFSHHFNFFLSHQLLLVHRDPLAGF